MLVEKLNINERVNSDKIVPAYTENGYKKMPIPKELYEIIKLARDRNHDHFYQGMKLWIVSLAKIVPCIERIIFNFFHVEPNHKRIVFDISKQVEVKEGITSILQPILEKWTQQILAPNPIIHGIRRYLRGAAMQLHVDSLPRIISAILQVSAPICPNPRSNKVMNFSFLWKNLFS